MKPGVLLALALAAAPFGAGAQVVPATDYTDMWWNPAESGWGISIRQKPPAGGTRDTMFAIWFTYDPRTPDATTAAATDYVPLWLPMTDGTWVTPTTYSLRVYVTKGTPFAPFWNPADFAIQEVGTATLSFSDASNGTFTYDIRPPANVAANNPAYGLPAFSGVKTITRQPF
jgi:hypothetical protein